MALVPTCGFSLLRKFTRIFDRTIERFSLLNSYRSIFQNNLNTFIIQENAYLQPVLATDQFCLLNSILLPGKIWGGFFVINPPPFMRREDPFSIQDQKKVINRAVLNQEKHISRQRKMEQNKYRNDILLNENQQLQKLYFIE